MALRYVFSDVFAMYFTTILGQQIGPVNGLNTTSTGRTGRETMFFVEL